MPVSLGNIPEDLRLGEVYEVALGTTLPAAQLTRTEHQLGRYWERDSRGRRYYGLTDTGGDKHITVNVNGGDPAAVKRASKEALDEDNRQWAAKVAELGDLEDGDN